MTDTTLAPAPAAAPAARPAGPRDRHHHERRLGPHGIPPAPRPLDPRDPRPGRHRAARRHEGHGQADPRRPQRGQARRARRQARHRGLHDRPRCGPRRPALGDLRRLPRDEGALIGSAQGDRGRQDDLHREAHRRDRRRGARAREARRRRGRQDRRRARQALPARPAEAQAPHRLRLLRPHPVGARRVRLLGVRGRLAARAAPELELPRRRRRRHHRRHVPALELRAREPVRRGQDGLRAGRPSTSPTRWDENGEPYAATAEDAAYGIFELEGGVDRADQLFVDRPRQPRRARRVPRRRHARLGRRRPVRREDPAPQRHPQARLEPRPRRRPRLRRRLGRGADERRVPERLPPAVGGVPRLLRRRAPTYEFDLLSGARGVLLAEAGLQSSREGRKVELPHADAGADSR